VGLAAARLRPTLRVRAAPTRRVGRSAKGASPTSVATEADVFRKVRVVELAAARLRPTQRQSCGSKPSANIASPWIGVSMKLIMSPDATRPLPTITPAALIDTAPEKLSKIAVSSTTS
jgi:hypothetical protein